MKKHISPSAFQGFDLSKSPRSIGKISLYRIFIFFTNCLLVFAAEALNQVEAAAGVNLNQARNGTDSIPINPMTWTGGNLGTGTAHYVEEMSSPMQAVMTGLTAGVQVTIIIGYDIMNGGKHAYDYLTHYNRIIPHSFTYHSTPETINPLNGTGLAANTPFSTYPIPMPSCAGSPVPGHPSVSFINVPYNQREMTLYNGTIDSMYYVIQGSLTASNSETQVAVKFTPSAATAVLAWGGHLASRNDWGSSSGSPNSAGGISGSPFHMRLVSWTLNNLGNQDRSLSGATVSGAPPVPLPVELTNLSVHAEGNASVVEWTTASEINNDYFTVERSSSTLNFETIGTVMGSGNCSVIKNYSFRDYFPQLGVSYYRLSQTDFDGTKKTFDPVCIRTNETQSNATSLYVFPNPSDGDVSVVYYSQEKNVALAEITDAYGKRVHSEIVNSTQGANNFECSTSTLSPGVYFITLSTGKNKSYTERIIKK